MKTHLSPVIKKKQRKIEFHIQNSCAKQICLAGSFNQWAKDQLQLKQKRNGLWTIEIPMLPHGQYQYRFIIDEHMEMEDIENPLRIPDGVAGFYSLLEVE
jgi:1,4-alpha-glucan branching enzyme